MEAKIKHYHSFGLNKQICSKILRNLLSTIWVMICSLGFTYAQKAYYHPIHDYSFQIPADWDTIPQMEIIYMVEDMDAYRDAPSQVKYDGGLTYWNNPYDYFAPPYVLFQYFSNPQIDKLSLTQLAEVMSAQIDVEMEGLSNSMGELISGISQNKKHIDHQRKAIFFNNTMASFPDSLRTVSGYFVDRNGLLGIYCYAYSDEYDLYQDDFAGLLESVRMDVQYNLEWEAGKEERELAAKRDAEYWSTRQAEEAAERQRFFITIGLVLLVLAVAITLGVLWYRRKKRAAHTPLERRSKLVGIFGTVLGKLLIVISIILFFVIQLQDIIFEDQFSNLTVLENILTAGLLGGFLGGMYGLLRYIGRRSYLKSKRHFTQSLQEKLERDPRPPVVYLRSFKDDELLSDSVGNKLPFFELFKLNTREEQLSKAMEKIGPFIAVGRPSKGLPEVGASRMYLSDKDWQNEVRKLIKKAALVVIRAGSSEGLWWEIRQAHQSVRPKRLLLIVPFDIDPSFYTRLNEEFGINLDPPERKKIKNDPINDFLVVFHPDWTPEIIIFNDASYRFDVQPVVERLSSA